MRTDVTSSDDQVSVCGSKPEETFTEVQDFYKY